MDTLLVVVQPFGVHAIGDVIADDEARRGALSGAHTRNVLRVAALKGVATHRKEA